MRTNLKKLRRSADIAAMKLLVVFSLSVGLCAAADPPADALNALHAMESISKIGATYPDYSRYLLDARVKVDAYARATKGTTNAQRDAIEEAMKFYDVAAQLWLNHLSRAGIGMNEMLAAGRFVQTSNCSNMKLIADRVDKIKAASNLSDADDRSLSIAILAGRSIGSFWVCAKDKLAEAEK